MYPVWWDALLIKETGQRFNPLRHDRPFFQRAFSNSFWNDVEVRSNWQQVSIGSSNGSVWNWQGKIWTNENLLKYSWTFGLLSLWECASTCNCKTITRVTLLGKYYHGKGRLRWSVNKPWTGLVSDKPQSKAMLKYFQLNAILTWGRFRNRNCWFNTDTLHNMNLMISGVVKHW